MVRPKSRICRVCGSSFLLTRRGRLYCSKRCNETACRRRNRKQIRAWHRLYYRRSETRRLAKLAYSREAKKRLKAETFTAYGGAICACCGEKELGFLTLDHIHGGGKQHRLREGARIYNSLKRNKWPSGYQVLCMNCNWGRRLTGTCPHKKEHIT